MIKEYYSISSNFQTKTCTFCGVRFKQTRRVQKTCSAVCSIKSMEKHQHHLKKNKDLRQYIGDHGGFRVPGSPMYVDEDDYQFTTYNKRK